jgi:hypothetical protein
LRALQSAKIGEIAMALSYITEFKYLEDEILTALKPLSKHQDPWIRGRAVERLSVILAERATYMLEEALNDSHPYVEFAALEALKSVLYKLTDSGSASVADKAEKALANGFLYDSCVYASRLLSRPHPLSKERAQKVIRGILKFRPEKLDAHLLGVENSMTEGLACVFDQALPLLRGVKAIKPDDYAMLHTMPLFSTVVTGSPEAKTEELLIKSLDAMVQAFPKELETSWTIAFRKACGSTSEQSYIANTLYSKLSSSNQSRINRLIKKPWFTCPSIESAPQESLKRYMKEERDLGLS